MPCFSQGWIEKHDGIQYTESQEIKDLLSIPITELDSIILNDLYLDVKLNYGFVSDLKLQGTTYYGFYVNNYQLDSTVLLRQAHDSISIVIKRQHQIIYDHVIKYLFLDSNQRYRIIIPVYYNQEYGNDSIYKDKNKYVIRNGIFQLKISIEAIQGLKKPKSLGDCLFNV